MTYEIAVSQEADAQADDVYEWIAQDSPGSAARWYNGLFEAIDTLKHNPQRCPVAPDNNAFNVEVRQLLYGKRQGVYRVLFTLSEETVHVLQIRHGARRFLDE